MCHTILNDLREQGLFETYYDNENVEEGSIDNNSARLLSALARFHKTDISDSKDENEFTEENEEEARRMHLYSRLYHRKGPWFRVDDLFHRYYPKSKDGWDHLIRDVTLLQEQGWVRTFASEEECAWIVEKRMGMVEDC